MKSKKIVVSLACLVALSTLVIAQRMPLRDVPVGKAYYLDGTMYVIDSSSNKIAVGTVTNATVTAITATTATLTTAVIPTLISSTLVSGATVFASTALKVGAAGTLGTNIIAVITNTAAGGAHIYVTNGVIVGITVP